MAIEEGKAAPAFTLADASGKKVSLADFAGKNVILYFYPKDDTPVAQGGVRLPRRLEDLAKANAVVLGSRRPARRRTRSSSPKYKLPFPLLSDPTQGDGEVRRLRRKNDVRQEDGGVIRSTVWIGPDGKVKRHWRKVASAEATPPVLAALQQ